MMKKDNKKKLLVLVLLLFAVVGIAGYGVYSYFWTQGEFTGSDDIEIASFDVNVDAYSNDFIGRGNYMNLTCEDTDGSGSATCSGSAEITNRGGTSVVVDVLNGSSAEDGSKYMSGTLSSPSFNWTSTTLAPGESKTLNVEVTLSNITNDFDSDTAFESDSGIQGSYEGYYKIAFNFDLKATQVH